MKALLENVIIIQKNYFMELICMHAFFNNAITQDIISNKTYRVQNLLRKKFKKIIFFLCFTSHH